MVKMHAHATLICCFIYKLLCIMRMPPRTGEDALGSQGSPARVRLATRIK